MNVSAVLPLAVVRKTLQPALLDQLTIGGAAQPGLLLLVGWLAWVTNWFDPDRRHPCRPGRLRFHRLATLAGRSHRLTRTFQRTLPG
jgi:hypothetical protein